MGPSSKGEFDRNEAVKKILQFYRRRRDAPKWSTKRRKFDEVRANKFFIGVMPDQLQTADSVAHPVPWTQVCLTRRA